MKNFIFYGILVCLLIPLNAFSQNKPVKIGDKENVTVATNHPYNANATGVVFEKEFNYPKSSFITLHFQNFDLTEGDYVEITGKNNKKSVKYDKTGRNNSTNFWSESIFDDVVVVRLHSSKTGLNYGFDITEVAYGYPQEKINTLAICSEDDMKDAICYQGTEMYKKSQAVCRVVIEQIYSCTGWLLGSEGHVMTNNHCISSSSQASTAEYHFEYQMKECGGSDYTNKVVATSSTLIKTNSGLDYTLLKLPVNPSNTYGYLSFRSAGVQVGERIYIPQHPLGYEKQITVEDDESPTGYARVTDNDYRVTYQSDTNKGSSGSPVLAYDSNLVVALHNSGGCSAAVGGNGGRRNDDIIESLGNLMPKNGVDSSGGGGNTPPTAPENLEAKDVTDSSVKLSWSASTDDKAVSGYEIFNGETSLGKTADLSFDVSGLTANTEYKFFVLAYDAEGAQSPKTSVTVTTKADDGPCTETQVIIAIKIDNYGNETNWKVTDANGDVVGSGSGYDANSTNEEKLCLPDGCYNFTITDDYGDGICCTYGNGSYQVKVGNNVLAEGGEFKDSDTKEFCIGKTDDKEAPTEPRNLVESNLTSTSVTLSWDSSRDNIAVTGYEVSQNGTLLNTVTETTAAIRDLQPNTAYTFEVVAYDAAGNKSTPGSIDVRTKPDDNQGEICKSKGNDTYYEWIQKVEFSSVNNDSGNNNGYGNFTSLTGNLAYGSNTVNVTAGYRGSAYPENVYIFIDFDNNGLTESDLVADGTVQDKNAKEFTFNVPNDVQAGSYTMRIALKYNADASPCGNFDYGEVEDYTVTIGNSSASKSIAQSVKVYPNPVVDILNVEGVDKNVEILVLDISGNVILRSKGNQVNVSSLSTGLYFVKAGNSKTTQFIKQ